MNYVAVLYIQGHTIDSQLTSLIGVWTHSFELLILCKSYSLSLSTAPTRFAMEKSPHPTPHSTLQKSQIPKYYLPLRITSARYLIIDYHTCLVEAMGVGL